MSKVPFITIVIQMYAFGFQMEEGYEECYVEEKRDVDYMHKHIIVENSGCHTCIKIFTSMINFLSSARNYFTYTTLYVFYKFIKLLI